MSDTLKNSLKNLMIDGAGLYTYTTKIYDKLAAQKDSLEADINGLSEDIDSLNEGYEGLTTRLDNMDTTLAGKASSTVTINGHALSEQTITLDAEDLGISAASLGLSSVYKFKNSVASYDLLEKITTKEVGDVYNVSDTGMNYAWDGTNWDSLGFDVDLSDYYVKTEVDSALAGKLSLNDTKSKGSTKQPVYFDANGKPTAIGYTIEKNVPSNAVFTDTTYSAGTGISISNTNVVSVNNTIATTSYVDNGLALKADISSLKTVATSGSYNDLTNKPTIPTVDTTLSTTSTNAIQNKAVATALNNKANSSDVYTKTEVDNNLSGYVQGSIATVAEVRSYFSIS